MTHASDSINIDHVRVINFYIISAVKMRGYKPEPSIYVYAYIIEGSVINDIEALI